MTRNYYRTGNYKPDHSTCGSIIYNYDFDGYVSMSSMAERIISDWKFDEKCKKMQKAETEIRIIRKELNNTYGKF